MMPTLALGSVRKMSLPKTLLLAWLLTFACPVAAQVSPTIENPGPASLSIYPHDQTVTPGDSHTVLNSNSEAGRQTSLRELIPNIVRDQKTTWLFPAQLAKGRHLKPFLLVTTATAALVALDPHDEPYFRNNSTFDKFKTGPIRGRNMTLAIVSVPLALYLGGLETGDSYAKNSGLLATESIADSLIADYALKAVFGRLHPSDIPAHGDFTHTWFKYPGPLSNPGSFPSGHAAMAFAAASIFARRYPRHRWVPWLVYGTATIIALTRIPDQAHFASDVFAGAALGYAIGHFIPLPQAGAGQ
jgi:membrane-associated phospholipid phosphatase